MPELPEAECVRRSLSDVIENAYVASVRLIQPARTRRMRANTAAAAMLEHHRLAPMWRHGKQLALVGSDGNGVVRAMPVHLGMSGKLHWITGWPGPRSLSHRFGPHVHVLWRLIGPDASQATLAYADPRRFGRLRAAQPLAELQADFHTALGPDALSIAPRQLAARLSRTRRAIKAALLDQAVVAGLGNIYADEALFAARIHPQCPSNALALDRVRCLVRSMRAILGHAIRAGGSSLTPTGYRDARNRPGRFQSAHRVYGRGGQRCGCCGDRLAAALVAGRTTTWCPTCQQALC